MKYMPLLCAILRTTNSMMATQIRTTMVSCQLMTSMEQNTAMMLMTEDMACGMLCEII